MSKYRKKFANLSIKIIFHDFCEIFLSYLFKFKNYGLKFSLGAILVLTGCTGTLLGLEDGIGLSTSSSDETAKRPLVSVQSVRAKDPQSKFGAREHPKIMNLYGGTYDSEQVSRMLAVIVGKLVEVADDPGRAYQITILDSPSVNAFALPGGYVYVTRGLLALANDSSELAAVVAHEMGHVVASHGILRNEKAKDINVANRVVKDLLGGQPSRISTSSATGKLLLAQFSRSQEFEADLLGIKIAGRAGYDPYAQARYLKSMTRYSAYKAGEIAVKDRLDFLSTHPSTPKRIMFAEQHAKQFGAPGVGVRDRDKYLQGLDGLPFGDTAEEGYVRGRTYIHPALRVTFQVPEGFRLDNRKEAIIATGPDKVAIRVDAAPLAPNKSLNTYLNSGWIGGLTPQSEKSSTINGLETLRARAAADGWLFDITLVRTGDRVYRLITAAPASIENLSQIGQVLASSFRRMTQNEASKIKPLRIKIHTVRTGDTPEKLAKKYMSWASVQENSDLIRVLNDISDKSRLKAGTKLKLVIDG